MHGFRVVLSDSLRLQKKEIQAGKENVEPNEVEVTTQSSAAVGGSSSSLGCLICQLPINLLKWIGVDTVECDMQDIKLLPLLLVRF